MVGEEEGMVEGISTKEVVLVVVSLVPAAVGEDSDLVEGQLFRQLWSIHQLSCRSLDI